MDVQKGVTVVIPTLQRYSLTTAVSSVLLEKDVVGVITIRGKCTPQQRNLGLAGVASDVVLFLDDDCVVDPGAISKAYQYMEENSLDALAPRISGGFASSPTKVFIGAGIFCRTEVAKAVSWDEGIRRGEDLDFAWRLMDAGYAWKYWEGATIYHIGEPRTPSVLKKDTGISSLGRLKEKHAARFDWLVRHNSSVLGIKDTTKSRWKPIAEGEIAQ